jgi:LPS O-antigen subunit length determinant protein (WzzB/FepE family)
MSDTQELPATQADDQNPMMSEPAEFYGGQAEPPDPLRRALRSLLRYWWIILLCGAIGLAAGIGVQRRQTKTYSATSFVLLAQNNFQPAISGGFNQTNVQNQEATVVGYLTPARQALAARNAGVPLDSSWSVDASPSSTSSVLPITASTENPRTAAALADAAANELIAVNTSSDEAQLKEARAVIHSQVRTAPTKNAKRALFGQLNTLATLQAISNHSIQIIQKADVPGAPSSPTRTRIGAIALVLGLVVGIAIALLLPERRRVRASAAPR